ncbi:MAG: hypothetical protein DWQ02_27180 [Bacteroidetes bacterium]|nr:MAG: hypothetical protein DWQ02_27180 [Bacteroidota bacterium]
MSKFLKQEKIFKYLSLAILITGGITRLVIFLQNRSLFLDEANLARNVVEKSPEAFFKALDYEQYAPPLFLLIQKFNVWWLGASEYAVRFFPLVAGLISLFLLYKIALKFIKPGPGLVFILFVFSFSEYFLHFGTEGKQYSSDVMFALLLIHEALKDHARFTATTFLKWTILGIVVIWFSMPSVFILAGVGIYLFAIQFLKKEKKNLMAIGTMIVLWLVSFIQYYFKILSADLNSDYLQNFHAPYFLPLIPTSGGDLSRIMEILGSVLSTSVGHTAIALITGLVSTIVGAWVVYKNDRKKWLLLLIPVFAVFGASAFRQYSLIPRLTLFFIPVVILLAGIGIQRLFDVKKIWLTLVFSILILGTLAIHDGVKYLWKPYQIEEIRLVLDQVSLEAEKDDLLYINHSAKPAFSFYSGLHKNKSKYKFDNVVFGDWRLNPETNQLRIGDQPADRVWVIYSHLISEQASIEQEKEMSVLLEGFKVVKKISFTGAQAILLERD